MATPYTRSLARELPSPTKLLATMFSAIILFSLLRFFAGEGPAPLFLTLATAILQVATLFLLGPGRDPAATFLRCGFHLGTFAFFVFYPLVAPEDAGLGISTSTVETVGWILVLNVVGFETAYWVTRLGRPSTLHRVTDFTLTERHQQVLTRLLYVGIFAWFVTVADYAMSANVSIIDVLMSMRAPVDGQRFEVEAFLSGRLVILQKVLAGGLFLAATAGSVLLISSARQARWLRIAAWLTLIVCAAGGFLSGARSFFFYAFTPLLMTCWLRLARSRLQGTRWLWAGGALAAMLVAWGAMSALRGGDIRKFQGGFEEFAPTIHARGAFDIYSQMGTVVQAFPDLFEYQHGKSLIPLVLGWVPRAAWPDKPYPFAIFMNILNGETVEKRAASIAVGLPGEGYGNFGLLGVFLWAAVAGLVCRRGDDYVGNFHPNHPLRLQIAGMSAIWVAMVVRGGVPEMFYQGLQIVTLPLGLAVYLFRAERHAPPVHPQRHPAFNQRTVSPHVLPEHRPVRY